MFTAFYILQRKEIITKMYWLWSFYFQYFSEYEYFYFLMTNFLSENWKIRSCLSKPTIKKPNLCTLPLYAFIYKKKVLKKLSHNFFEISKILKKISSLNCSVKAGNWDTLLVQIVCERNDCGTIFCEFGLQTIVICKNRDLFLRICPKSGNLRGS